MSNSQEQSLDENVVFLPVHESSPEFLHSERERQAVERLLSAGPEAFYSSVGTERPGCFLSPEEVSQISNWAQDYRLNQLQEHRELNGEADSSEVEDFYSTYFPSYSDTPTPDLELGWPEKGPWVPKRSVTVHTSPPTEGDPPVREIIRRLLQKAGQVIAIVTDRLTDGAIIGDLHNAASRGVPVYIILNQRSIQENFTLHRLRHPNIRVRVLGGKTFCSRVGKMVVGEMKNKFLLVDLETVIHGSYSLTWTDAHLHRQLITVLRGPVVDSFDREFRILYAASLSIPNTWRVPSAHVDATYLLKDPLNLGAHKQFPLEPDIISPPSPPPDSRLDWEAMGVIQREQCFPESPLDQCEEIMDGEMLQQNNMLSEETTPIMDGLTTNGNPFVEEKIPVEPLDLTTTAKVISGNSTPVVDHVPDEPKLLNDTQPLPTAGITPERMKRIERIIEKALSKQPSAEKKSHAVDRVSNHEDKDKAPETPHNKRPSTKRREHSRREPSEDEDSVNETISKVENTPSSRKPLILKLGQSESFSSLSDIMKRIQSHSGTSKLHKFRSKGGAEVSQSMMDLSDHKKEENDATAPRRKARGFDSTSFTPAQILRNNRNDEFKPLMHRTPKNFLPRERPRSSSYAMDWRRSLAEMEGEQETGVKK
ncbi:uncharacterized protein V6R79_025568 [Siganus canaliculatus]